MLTPTLFNTQFRAPALNFAKRDPHDAYLHLSEQLGLFNKFRLADTTAKPTVYFKAVPAASPAAKFVNGAVDAGERREAQAGSGCGCNTLANGRCDSGT